MQERGKRKQRQSIIMLSAVQTDIETKAQVGPHTAQQGKALQNKNRKKKKTFSSTYIAPQKLF